MNKLSMCRICLVENVNMYSLVNTKLQDLYEKLTAMPFETEDSRPLQVCYMCHARLSNCYQLQASCLKSERIFAEMGIKNWLKPTLLQDVHCFKLIHPLVHLSCVPGAPRDRRDGLHKVDCLDTLETHIKEENVEDAQDNNRDDELSVQYTRVEIVIKAEPVNDEPEDDESNNNPCTAQTLQNITDTASNDRNIEPHIDTEYSVKYTPDVRNIDTIVQNEMDPSHDKPSTEMNDDKIVKPIKIILKRKDLSVKTSTNDAKKSKVPEDNENISNKGETEAALDNRIQYTCELKTYESYDQRARDREKVTEVGVQTVEKPYQCDQCDKCFESTKYLRRHICLHNGGKPFKCNTCDKSFSDQSNLTRHIRIHTGEKRYKCDTCHKGFTDKSNLNKHLYIHNT